VVVETHKILMGIVMVLTQSNNLGELKPFFKILVCNLSGL